MRKLVVLSLLALLVACRPPDSAATAAAAPSGVQVRIITDGAPALGRKPVLVYVLEDNEGIAGATVEVTGDMTHAGMVPVVRRAVPQEHEDGLYRADDFEFTMAGDWVLTADVTLPDGRRASNAASLSVPGR